MEPRTHVAWIRNAWTHVLNPVDNRTVFEAKDVAFRCPECGKPGSLAMAATDNPLICGACYDEALAEIEDGA